MVMQAVPSVLLPCGLLRPFQYNIRVRARVATSPPAHTVGECYIHKLCKHMNTSTQNYISSNTSLLLSIALSAQRLRVSASGIVLKDVRLS